MDAAGILDERYDEVDDLVRARHLPSPQLIGTPEPDDRSTSTRSPRCGVRIVGRLGGITDGVAQFSGGLANVCALADLKMNRLLDRFDEWARANGHATRSHGDRPERFEPTRLPSKPLARNRPAARGDIGTIVWATGYRPDYSWLDLPVFDRKGSIRHDGGVVADAPGVYLLGATLLRRRRSSFIHGAEADTADLSTELHTHLDRSLAGTRR